MSPGNPREKHINNRKFAELRGPDAGTAVHQRTTARAPTHGHALGSRVLVRPGTAGRAPVLLAMLVLPRVHGHAPLSHTRV